MGGWEKGKGAGAEGGMVSRNGKEVLKKITSRCSIPVKAHALIKEGTVFNDYCVLCRQAKTIQRAFGTSVKLNLISSLATHLLSCWW